MNDILNLSLEQSVLWAPKIIGVLMPNAKLFTDPVTVFNESE